MLPVYNYTFFSAGSGNTVRWAYFTPNNQVRFDLRWEFKYLMKKERKHAFGQENDQEKKEKR